MNSMIWFIVSMPLNSLTCLGRNGSVQSGHLPVHTERAHRPSDILWKVGTSICGTALSGLSMDWANITWSNIWPCTALHMTRNLVKFERQKHTPKWFFHLSDRTSQRLGGPKVAISASWLPFWLPSLWIAVETRRKRRVRRKPSPEREQGWSPRPLPLGEQLRIEW